MAEKDHEDTVCEILKTPLEIYGLLPFQVTRASIVLTHQETSRLYWSGCAA
jgi:hypothetical protein